MHSSAMLLAAVVYNDRHWALAMHHRKFQGLSSTIVYDGKCSDLIRDQATALMHHCGEVWRTDSPPPVQTGKVPSQDDDWSCGWRLLCALDAALHHWQKNGELPHELEEKHVGLPAVCEMIKSFASWQEIRPSEETPSAKKSKPSQLVGAPVSDDQAEPTPSKSLKPAEEVLCPVLDDQEMEPIEPTPRPKKRKSQQEEGKTSAKKVKGASLQRKGEEIAKEHGIDHNIMFQKRHQEGGIVIPNGHWKLFLESLARGQRNVCSICQDLQSLCSATPFTPQEEQTHRDDALEDASGNVDLAPRGRPQAGQRLRCVHRWIEEERKGIYRRLTGPNIPYWCYVCKKQIHVVRSCNEKYVLEHEKSMTHRKGLCLTNAAEQIVQADALEGPCAGFLVSNPAFPLNVLSESAANWLSAGCPHVRSRPHEVPSALSEVRLNEECEDKAELRFRSAKCETKMVRANEACSTCFKLGRKSLKELATWSFMIDLGHYSSALFYNPHKAEDQLKVIEGRDYKTLGLAGALMDDIFKIRSAKQKIAFISSRFQCFPKCRRSTSLQQFMSIALPEHALHASNDEMALYGDLLRLDLHLLAV